MGFNSAFKELNKTKDVHESFKKQRQKSTNCMLVVISVSQEEILKSTNIVGRVKNIQFA